MFGNALFSHVLLNSMKDAALRPRYVRLLIGESFAASSLSANRFVGNSCLVPSTSFRRTRFSCPSDPITLSRHWPTQTGFRVPRKNTVPFWYLRRAIRSPSTGRASRLAARIVAGLVTCKGLERPSHVLGRRSNIGIKCNGLPLPEARLFLKQRRYSNALACSRNDLDCVSCFHSLARGLEFDFCARFPTKKPPVGGFF